MNEYNNGKIYKITSPDMDQIYIGSTTLELSERLRRHESDYNRYLNGKRNNITAFELIKQNSYSITLIENVNVENRKELERIE